jgi:hypothetical protein
MAYNQLHGTATGLYHHVCHRLSPTILHCHWVVDSAEVEATAVENMIGLYYHGRCRGLAVVACRFAESQYELPLYLPLASFLLEPRYFLLSRYGIRYRYLFLMKPSAWLRADCHASPTQTGNLSVNRLPQMNRPVSPLHSSLQRAQYRYHALSQ